MPPSSEKESSHTASSPSQSNKSSQKASSAGVQIPPKNGRKNGAARDGGDSGILAAVTKNSSKMPNSKPSSISSRLQPSEQAPAGSVANGNTVISPLLDALSSAALTQSSQTRNEWIKSPDPFSSSQNNLIHVDDSSDTQPSSYEDRLAHFGWTTKEQRGISPPTSHPPSTSPPTNRPRPMSYHLDGNYPRSSEDPNTQSSYATRRSSMFSQYGRYGLQPPLPHQAQAHFYGAPDADLFLPSTGTGLAPGDNGYYCGFDSLPAESQDPPRAIKNVILTGYDGGLDIFAVSKRSPSKISTISGLRGGVYNAKVLPCSFKNSHSALVAVVVHGPAWRPGGALNGDLATPKAISGRSDTSPEPARDHTPPGQENNASVGLYQTTVEVYSLVDQQHVATLLSMPTSHSSTSPASPLFRPPAPVGSLSIRADSHYIVISSGTTGETWIFLQSESDSSPLAAFKCIGKVWTTIQHGLTVDSASPQGDGERRHADLPPRQQQRPSILSLNGRWLAYCPSKPSSQVTLRATVPDISTSDRIPGLNGQAPPQLPPANCLVEMPGGESIMKQLAQVATQEVIKGAAYLGKQGVQAWNNYWNKSSTQQPPDAIQYQSHPGTAQQFPPTHGVPNQAPAINKDPGLISILDLDSLSRQSSPSVASPHPLATFRVPHGCSFLSFTPNGLALFTASSKGDVQFVWDLMRIQYTRSSFLRGGAPGSGSHSSHVRQVAQFSRMTIARIVDVAWTSPHGERAAMVTEPGTIHILDLPASAFTWPPPRQKLSSHKPDDDASATPLTAAGVASSAVSTLWTAARPLVNRRRRSSIGMSTISAATVTAQAGHGTQALAAGISRSVGAATGRVNEMRKAGSPKLHLPQSTVTPNRACVRLLDGRRNDLVLAVAAGIVRAYTVKGRRADRPADKQKASRGARYVEFRLPPLPGFAPSAARQGDQGLDYTAKETGPSQPNYWPPENATPRSHGAGSSIPQAEIESNAPYQPFHTDRRVGLYIYAYGEAALSSPSASALLGSTVQSSAVASNPPRGLNSPWSFGGSIKATKLNVGSSQPNEESFYAPSDHLAPPQSAIERVTKVADRTDDMEQIVVTTRMRKGGRADANNSENADEEGFFEDDCEVLDFASQRV